MGDREKLGRLVRETWVAWAREQPGAKPGWLISWDGPLDPGQREVDMRIGEVVAAQERRRIVGDDGRSLELMLESAAALDEPGLDVAACARVVRRLLEGEQTQ